ncbi:MAG: hypothetical protein WC901_02050 [Candidatus Margulisiibacteriota bacterium]
MAVSDASSTIARNRTVPLAYHRIHDARSLAERIVSRANDHRAVESLSATGAWVEGFDRVGVSFSEEEGRLHFQLRSLDDLRLPDPAVFRRLGTAWRSLSRAISGGGLGIDMAMRSFFRSLASAEAVLCDIEERDFPIASAAMRPAVAYFAQQFNLAAQGCDFESNAPAAVAQRAKVTFWEALANSVPDGTVWVLNPSYMFGGNSVERMNQGLARALSSGDSDRVDKALGIVRERFKLVKLFGAA